MSDNVAAWLRKSVGVWPWDGTEFVKSRSLFTPHRKQVNLMLGEDVYLVGTGSKGILGVLGLMLEHRDMPIVNGIRTGMTIEEFVDEEGYGDGIETQITRPAKKDDEADFPIHCLVYEMPSKNRKLQHLLLESVVGPVTSFLFPIKDVSGLLMEIGAKAMEKAPDLIKTVLNQQNGAVVELAPKIVSAKTSYCALTYEKPTTFGQVASDIIRTAPKAFGL